jgi:hypothetical protein
MAASASALVTGQDAAAMVGGAPTRPYRRSHLTGDRQGNREEW